MNVLGGRQQTLKLWIRYPSSGAAPVEHEFTRDHPLDWHVAQLVKALGAFTQPGHTESSHYCLQVESDHRYLTPADLQKGAVAQVEAELEDARVILILKPVHRAQRAIEQLSDSNPLVQKKAIFSLRKSLDDPAFAEAFLQANGIQEIVRVIHSSTRSTLAYALSALECALSYRSIWTGSASDITYLVQLIPNPVLNIKKSALKIVAQLVAIPSCYEQVLESLQETARKQNHLPFSVVIECLSSPDLDVQLNAFELVAALSEHAADREARRLFLLQARQAGLNSAAKKLLHLRTPAFQRAKFAMQQQILSLTAGVPYSDANEEHEAMLRKLWSTMNPKDELDNRISQKWKKMGFQGTNPATDFRGMGVTALEHLLYIAEKHHDVFRGILAEQDQRTDNDYPVCTAGINISQLLCDVMNVNAPVSSTGTGTIFPCLYDHLFPVEEIYCIAFELLDQTWDDMNASYMEFPKVIATVRQKLSDGLAQCHSLSGLQEYLMSSSRYNQSASPRLLHAAASGSSAGGSGTLSHGSSASILPGGASSPGSALQKTKPAGEVRGVKELRAQVERDIWQLVASQKTHIMCCGHFFPTTLNLVLPAQKHATPAASSAEDGSGYYLQLSADSTTLYWTASTAVAPPPQDFDHSLKVNEITALKLATDTVLAQQANQKKVDADAFAMVFEIEFRSENGKTETIDLVAPNRRTLVDWLDGIRSLMQQPMQCAETNGEHALLTKMELQTRMLDLDGVALPSKPPPVPDPPLILFDPSVTE